MAVQSIDRRRTERGLSQWSGGQEWEDVPLSGSATGKGQDQVPATYSWIENHSATEEAGMTLRQLESEFHTSDLYCKHAV